MSKYKVGDKVKLNAIKLKHQSPWYTVDPDDVFEITYVYQFCDGVYQISAHVNDDFRIVSNTEPQLERMTIREDQFIPEDWLELAEPKTEREDI